MNNWGIFFIVLGVLITLSIVSGYLLTNKMLNTGVLGGNAFSTDTNDVDSNDVAVA